MPTGTVKWFNNAKGYGFILPEGGGDDLFVHYSSIAMDGYKTLKAGQSVEYETRASDKGEQATDVRAHESETPPPIAPIRSDHAITTPGNGLTGARPAPQAAGAADAVAVDGIAVDGIAAAMLSAAHDD